jgi:hypothetical protein
MSWTTSWKTGSKKSWKASWIGVGLVMVATAWTGTASAQGFLKDTRSVLFDRDSFALQVGGGFMNFTQGGAKALTGPGGDWTLRATWGQDQILGSEVAYLGAAFPVESPVMNDGVIVQTGVEGLLRLGLPLTWGNQSWVFTPYAAGGVGWSHFNLAGAADINPAGIKNDDTVFYIPWGFGIAGTYKNFSADARLIWRPAFGDDLFEAANTTADEAGQNTVSIGATLGWHF